MKRRYSLHLIQPSGVPQPIGGRVDQFVAIDAAEKQARITGLEVKVWDVDTATCIYTVPAVPK